MKFLIDANLPATLRATLDVHGTVWHVRDLNLEAAADSLVMRAAIDRRAVLVTRDLGFGNPFIYPLAVHAGVIVVRVPSSYRTEAIAAVVAAGLAQLGMQRLTHTVVVMEPGRIRIRRKR